MSLIKDLKKENQKLKNDNKYLEYQKAMLLRRRNELEENVEQNVEQVKKILLNSVNIISFLMEKNGIKQISVPQEMLSGIEKYEVLAKNNVENQTVDLILIGKDLRKRAEKEIE